MSFREHKDVVEEGDTVILYLTVFNMHAIEARTEIKNKLGEMVENVFQTTYGALKIKDIIGARYGTKVIETFSLFKIHIFNFHSISR